MPPAIAETQETQMKIFTYLRTVWHEFWMYMLVGAPSKEEGLAPRVDPYWTLLVANNINRIHDALGTEVVPETEEEARALYLRWCEVTDVKEEPKLTSSATVITGSLLAREMSEGMTRSCNLTPFMDFRGMVKSEKKLWVYNASRVDHKFDHPMLGNVTIPANKTRKRYSLWTSFPEVVMGTNYNIDENLLYPHAIKGEYFVNDIIDPDNVLGTTYHRFKASTAIGRDLSVRGVFWSYNNPPKVSEVNAAVKKLKAHYADLLERMEIIYTCAQIDEETILRYRKQNPDASFEEALRETRVAKVSLEVTPECHAACEYFKVTTPWHPVLRG